MPFEVILPERTSRRTSIGLLVRRSNLRAGELTEIADVRVTALNRTLRDLCLFGKPVDALIAIDSALRHRRVNKLQLLGDPVATPRRRGAARLRRLVELAQPAESPMETRLRWLLLRRRLPRPAAQVDLRDTDGILLGRADLLYASQRLVVEFDGGNHRDRLAGDDRRQNALVNAGYRVLRFTAADVLQTPEATVAQVRAALKQA